VRGQARSGPCRAAVAGATNVSRDLDGNGPTSNDSALPIVAQGSPAAGEEKASRSRAFGLPSAKRPPIQLQLFRAGSRRCLPCSGERFVIKPGAARLAQHELAAAPGVAQGSPALGTQVVTGALQGGAGGLRSVSGNRQALRSRAEGSLTALPGGRPAAAGPCTAKR